MSDILYSKLHNNKEQVGTATDQTNANEEQTMNWDLTKIESLADRILERYRTLLQDKDINASKQLSDTATVSVQIDNNHLIISLNLTEYWKYVEYGRRPGKRPPIEAIENWIKIKPVVPNPINGKVPSTRQLAFLISRKIGRDGIPGKKVLSETVWSDETETVMDKIRNELVNQLRQYLLESLK